MQQQYRDVPATAIPSMQRRQVHSKQRFVTDLSQRLFEFVIQLLPTQEEMAVKEDVRKLLERLIRTIEPDSRLLSFGSTANGFSLRNSDMDLCCLIDCEERLSATDLVTMLGDLLERETKFHVKPLPHARIPIVKLSLDPSPGLPLGIACDIGFENRLALENTRLLMCYAMVDPTRVRTIVLFRELKLPLGTIERLLTNTSDFLCQQVKVWSKRRKINSPYKGTLSSYGYVLLVIYFLVHVKNPPVLPNLQQMPPLRPISEEDTHINGHNIWFFDDIDLLRQRWHSENNESVAQLLIDFFRYYSRDFMYNNGVASIRAGLLKKESKGWQNDLTARYNDARERNRFCIEDPFEIDYNVARCVTKDGLYTIRGEFMRASRILASRPDRAIVALAELCEERKDEELVAAPPYVSRSVTLPPQTPYTVGNQTMRPKVAERFSPPAQFFEPGPQAVQPATIRPPPEHMAPKRGKWTSPPPPEAPSADHTLFESQLGIGLQLATLSTEAREKETAYNSSESNSEIFTDEGSDEAEDDIKSVKSYTEGSSVNPSVPSRRPWQTRDNARPHNHIQSGSSTRSSSSNRGRFPRTTERVELFPPSAFRTPNEPVPTTSRFDFGRRSTPGRPRSLQGPPWPSNTTPATSTPHPPSPESPMDPRFSDQSNVFYQTTAQSPRPTVLYPSSGTHSLLSQYQSSQEFSVVQAPPDILPENLLPSLSSLNPRAAAGLSTPGRSLGGPDTPTPASYSASHPQLLPTPAITPLSKPSAQQSRNTSPLVPFKYHPSSPKLPSTPHRASPPTNTTIPDQSLIKVPVTGVASLQPSGTNSNNSSPAPSSAGYSTSISRSPSPHSPSPPPTAVPFLSKQKDDGLSYRTSHSALNVEAASVHLPRVSSTGFVVALQSTDDKEDSSLRNKTGGSGVQIDDPSIFCPTSPPNQYASYFYPP